MRFEGQKVVITGSARGIGFATATKLAEEGATVAIVDQHAANAEDAATRLRANGHAAHAFAFDVALQENVQDGFRAINQQFGKIDALINAAAIFPPAAFEELGIEQWKRTLDVNLSGTFLCCQAVYSLMKEAGYGRIVNIATNGVDLGLPGMAAYVASKAGVIGLTRVIASEGGTHGITANVVAPGLIITEAVHSLPNGLEEAERVIPLQAIKRSGQPGDIAEAIAYLSSPAAGFITGQTVTINGGMTFK